MYTEVFLWLAALKYLLSEEIVFPYFCFLILEDKKRMCPVHWLNQPGMGNNAPGTPR